MGSNGSGNPWGAFVAVVAIVLIACTALCVASFLAPALPLREW